jgi:hypothetical protein
MTRIFVPTMGPSDWRRLLADPEKQWKPGKSAFEMAVCWEAARESERGFPPEIAEILDSAPETHKAQLLLGLPEHRVPFKGGGHPSQNDLWALLRTPNGYISLAIEAKAGEPPDKVVSQWLPKQGEPSGKAARLQDLQERLGIADTDVTDIRYQFLHRAASALKEADRFGAQWAVFIVQSFDRVADRQSWDDFHRFGQMLGVDIAEGRLAQAGTATKVPLSIGWVTSQPAGIERLTAAT